MMNLLTGYFFLFGVCIGSFLNVLILRHNTGKTLGGRSACMTCKQPLTPKELVPFFSFVFQKGRCAHCHSKISIQYPFVELSTGILFALNFYFLATQSYSIGELAITFILTSSILALMVATFVYDFKHKIIPDTFSFGMFGLSIAYVFFSTIVFQNNLFWIAQDSSSSLFYFDAGMGVLLYLLVYCIWKLSRGRVIGLGDAKLLLSMGTILGVLYGLSTFFLSFWIGSVVAIYLLIQQKISKKTHRLTMKSEIAFGPFLIIAFIVVYFLKIDITNLAFILKGI